MSCFGIAREQQIETRDSLVMLHEALSAAGQAVTAATGASELEQVKATNLRVLTIQQHVLAVAKTMFWSERCARIVYEASKLLNLDDYLATEHSCYGDPGDGQAAWCWFERPVLSCVFEEEGDPRPWPIVALSWGIVQQRGEKPWWMKFGMPTGIVPTLTVAGYAYDRASNVIAPVVSNYAPVGQPFNRNIDSILGPGRAMTNDTVEVCRFVVAAEAFLRQRLAVATPSRIDRGTRRRLERAGRDASDVEVVTLRASESTRSNEPGEVDWSCRWMVSSHWRRQWLPSKGVHVPKLIGPYWKGPEDAPVKLSRPTIVAVTR